jgi:hypothetical protein
MAPALPSFAAGCIVSSLDLFSSFDSFDKLRMSGRMSGFLAQNERALSAVVVVTWEWHDGASRLSNRK